MNKLLMLLIASTVLLWPASLALAAPALNPYTPENFWILPHHAPTGFVETNDGFVGEVSNGYRFTQVVIENELGVRLQKFSIGEVSFYLSDKGVIKANNDLGAISIYLYLA